MTFVTARGAPPDVVGGIDGRVIGIETKGGCIDTRHPGQRSRLRRRLREAVGQLMATPRSGARVIAAPRHSETEAFAHRMVERRRLAGIEIAPVDEGAGVALRGQDQ